MKKIILLFIVLGCFSTFSQFSVESSFNSVFTGRNLNLVGKYQWGNFSTNFGLKYNFNKLKTFPSGEIFKKTFWAIDFGEHWGVETGCQYKILKKENYDLFGFYQLQITKSHIRLDWLSIIGSLVPEPQSEYDLIYIRKLDFVGPVWAFENNLGLGLNVYFSDSFYFTTKLGGGVILHKNTDPGVLIIGANNFDFSAMVSMGLGWRFSTDDKSN